MKPSNTNTQQVERDITGDTDTTTSGEQAADLAALHAAAAGAPLAPGAAPEPEPQGPDLAKEIAGLVTVAVGILKPMFPSLGTTYTPEVTEAAAQAVAGVCNKHGWLSGGMMGKWGEEIACLAIVGPLAWQTAQGIRADLAARAPAEPLQSIAGPDLTATTAPAAPVGQKTVTFGAAAPVGA